jgi:hypothetical protein
VLRSFGVKAELFRDAPDYDFRAKPPPPAWLYDAHGWPLKGADWLLEAGRALDKIESPEIEAAGAPELTLNEGVPPKD